MLIIDTETHIFWFARNHMTTGLSMIYHYSWHEHSADLLVAEMDRAGVSKTFLISYDAEDGRWDDELKGYAMEDFAGGKKYTKVGWKKYPDRFCWFSTVKSPEFYPTAAIAKQDLEDGAVGIKVFPGYLRIPVNHPALLDTFALCAEKNARVLISFEMLKPPLTLSLPEYSDQMDEVLTTFPQVRFCLLHTGCADPLTPDMSVIYRLMDRYPNLYLSTAFPGEKWDDGTEYPFANYLQRMEKVIKHCGSDRVMWATDWPWFEHVFKYEQGVNAILRHADFLSEFEKENFMGKTAAKFLGDRM